MKEIEVKILNINPEEIRKKLLDLGAKKTFEGDVDIITFEHPNININPKDELLRLRKLGNKIELCYKKKDQNSVVRSSEEIEVNVSNYENTLIILKKLGFTERFNGGKIRESYKKGDLKFEVDTYPWLPPFLEIEAPSEEQLITTVKELGYIMEQTTLLHSGELFELQNNGEKTIN